MDLKEVFGSARAEHEADHPTPAARPILIVEDNSIIGRLLFPMLRVRDNASIAVTGVAEEPAYPLNGHRISMKPVSREQFFEMVETDDPKMPEFAREAACPRS